MKWTKNEIWELIYHAESNWDTSPPEWDNIADQVNNFAVTGETSNNRTAAACKNKYYKTLKDQRLKNG